MSDTVTVALIAAVPLAIGQLSVLVQGHRNHSTAKSIERSIGPENGESLHDILARIASFEGYQHARNHDLINLLVGMQFVLLELAVKAGVPVQDVLDALTRRYVDNEHPPAGAEPVYREQPEGPPGLA